jgi:hypothetical protein
MTIKTTLNEKISTAAALSDFIVVVSNLKVRYGHPDFMTFADARRFYGLVAEDAPANLPLGWLLMAMNDALAGSWDDYDACLDSAATERKLDRDLAIADAA